MPSLLNRLATDQREFAERKWRVSPKPARPQKPCDHGLFSDDHLQLDLVEILQSAAGNGPAQTGRDPMNTTTLDGHSVTNVLQFGEFAGTEGKRVWIKTDARCWNWWECSGLAEARAFVRRAKKMTISALVAELDGH